MKPSSKILLTIPFADLFCLDGDPRENYTDLGFVEVEIKNGSVRAFTALDKDSAGFFPRSPGPRGEPHPLIGVRQRPKRPYAIPPKIRRRLLLLDAVTIDGIAPSLDEGVL